MAVSIAIADPSARLTLELVTVGDFALPVAGLFVQVKGQSAGARDLLEAGPCTPNGAGQKTKKGACVSLRREKAVMSLTLELIAVLHVRLPVAGLPLDVERETRRASHRRQSGHADLGGFVAPRMSFLHRTIFPDFVGARDRSETEGKKRGRRKTKKYLLLRIAREALTDRRLELFCIYRIALRARGLESRNSIEAFRDQSHPRSMNIRSAGVIFLLSTTFRHW